MQQSPGCSFACNEVSLLINDQTSGHQSSAAPPHTESMTQDMDGSNHDDNRLDTKATVQGTGAQIIHTVLSVCRCGERKKKEKPCLPFSGTVVLFVQLLNMKDWSRKAAATAKTCGH